MKPGLSPGQMTAFTVGILLVAAVDVLTPWHLSGPGLDGALRAAFWYGLVGVGGGLCGYEVFQRIASTFNKGK